MNGMNEDLQKCHEADLKYAAEPGKMVFVRAAEIPEIELFREFVGEPGGLGPRTLYIVVGQYARIFVSWPRDIALPGHTEQDLRALLTEAAARKISVVVIEPVNRN